MEGAWTGERTVGAGMDGWHTTTLSVGGPDVCLVAWQSASLSNWPLAFSLDAGFEDLRKGWSLQLQGQALRRMTTQLG